MYSFDKFLVLEALFSNCELSFSFQEGQVIWTRNTQPKESELMYNYTALAIELNEPEVSFEMQIKEISLKF